MLQRLLMGALCLGLEAAYAQAKPARPTLPIQVSEAVWAALESSEAYAASTPARPARAHYATSSTLSGSPYLLEMRLQVSPAGERLLKAESSSSTTINGKTIAGPSTGYAALGGLLMLWSTDMQGNVSTLTKLDPIQGALVPPRPGAELRIRSTTTHPMAAMENIQSCRMGEPMVAANINAKLAGNAWPVQCEHTMILAGNANGITHKRVMFYLEDLGYFTSVTGITQIQMQGQQQTHSYGMPAAGTKFESFSGTTTVTRYDLSIE